MSWLVDDSAIFLPFMLCGSLICDICVCGAAAYSEKIVAFVICMHSRTKWGLHNAVLVCTMAFSSLATLAFERTRQKFRWRAWKKKSELVQYQLSLFVEGQTCVATYAIKNQQFECLSDWHSKLHAHDYEMAYKERSCVAWMLASENHVIFDLSSLLALWCTVRDCDLYCRLLSYASDSRKQLACGFLNFSWVLENVCWT